MASFLDGVGTAGQISQFVRQNYSSLLTSVSAAIRHPWHFTLLVVPEEQERIKAI